MSGAGPELTILMVTPERWETLRRPLRHLAAQTARDRVELILIGPGPGAFEGFRPGALEGFHDVRLLHIGPIHEVERAFAPGIREASAPVVALLENHVYASPEWAETIIEAHRGPWTVVGTAITNANRATATSWVEHLTSYVFHDELAPTGEVAQVSRNNVTYKKEALIGFGDRLQDVLARDGGLLQELERQGARFYRAGGVELEHLNPSRTAAMLVLRLHSARASAATRARTGGWSVARRWGYALLSPLFPILRLRVLWPRLWSEPVRSELARITPLLLVALAVDAVGQALGFALGAGSSAGIAGRFDLDREPYLTPADRAAFMS